MSTNVVYPSKYNTSTNGVKCSTEFKTIARLLHEWHPSYQEPILTICAGRSLSAVIFADGRGSGGIERLDRLLADGGKALWVHGGSDTPRWRCIQYLARKCRLLARHFRLVEINQNARWAQVVWAGVHRAAVDVDVRPTRVWGALTLLHVLSPRQQQAFEH